MKISVITPSFRQLELLELCAASVADQSGDFEHEHLIQDGGSGEDLMQWAEGQRFADVRMEPDDGMYDAINRGFRRSSGDILCWLNCDEQYLTNTLERVSQWFIAHPNKDVLFGDVILISADWTPIAYRQAMVPWPEHTRHCFLATYSAATFIRRRVIEEGHFLSTEYRMISDALWICELQQAGFECGVLNEPLATFIQTGENMGQQPAGLAEGLRWQATHGPGRLIPRTFWEIAHRMRKLAIGAYQPREVEIMIHRDGSGERSKVTGRVGGRWRKK